MSPSTKAYKRLPGKKAGLFSRHTLWAGKDHLLQIHSWRVREKYKRYYYEDIQAVYIHKTASMLIESWIIGLLLAASLVTAWFAYNPALYVVSVYLGLLLLYELFRGPTCECHIQTLVQKEQIHSLFRVKTARRAIGIFQPMISEAQGRVTEAMLQNAEQTTAEAAPGPDHPDPDASPEKPVESRTHILLFCLLLVSGIVTGADIPFEHMTLAVASAGISSAAVIFAIVALVKQYEVQTGKAIQTLTWASLGFLCLEMLMGCGLYMYILFTHADAAFNQWEAFRRFSALSPLDKPLLLSIFLFSAIGSALLGMAGLAFCLRNRRRRKAARPRLSSPSGPVASASGS